MPHNALQAAAPSGSAGEPIHFPARTVGERLDDFNARLQPHTARDLIPALIRWLHRLRLDLGPDGWNQTLGVLKNHPLAERLREDPFTRRGFSQPRGLATDAVMLDCLFQGTPAIDPASALGRAIFDVIANRSPSAVAARERRDWCANWINEAADRAERPIRVASIGCGHLREAELSFAVASGRVADFLAVDQDQECLAVVAGRHPTPPVRPIKAGVEELLRQDSPLEGIFDLIYSPVLYDSLDRASAQATTERLFQSLAPGGRLCVANFVPNFGTNAYVEAFMNASPITRDSAAMQSLVTPKVQLELERGWTFHSTNRCIVYLSLERRRS